MLASQSHWPPNPSSSDSFGDIRNPGGYENGNPSLNHEGRDYFSHNSSSFSSAHSSSSKSRTSSSKMPSKSSSSRRSSTVDADYEWDDSSIDTKKKSSRSKLPAEDKLVKRRDQNRVSQRAFRQRKEKHTKELEAKVEELENMLESASHENSVVTSQMSRMEEELCYYRRLLFSDSNAYLPPTSTSSSSSLYNTSYGPTPALASVGAFVNSPRSNTSSSTHSSPALSNIPGDFAPVTAADSYWGYDVPTTQGYMQFNNNNTSGTSNGW